MKKEQEQEQQDERSRRMALTMLEETGCRQWTVGQKCVAVFKREQTEAALTYINKPQPSEDSTDHTIFVDGASFQEEAFQRGHEDRAPGCLAEWGFPS